MTGASAPASDVCEVLASEKQASQGRRERAYLEGTCASENEARRKLLAVKTRRILLAGALPQVVEMIVCEIREAHVRGYL